MSRWWFGEVPAARTATVRTLVFGYAAVWLTVRSAYVIDTARLPDRRFEPVGIWAALDDPLPVGVVGALLATGIVGCGLAAFGRWATLTVPIGAVAATAVITASNSWGQVFHTENLLVLHLLVFAGAAVLGARLTDGWPLRLASVLTVTVYVLAGWAKLDIGGTDWLAGDVLRNQVAYDNLRKILLGDVHSPVGGWLVGIDAVWVPIGVLTLVVELGAPFSLLGGRIRTAWVGAAWLFHLAILATMAILFPYPLSGIAFVSMFDAERLRPLVGRVTGFSRRSRTAPSPPPDRH